MATIFACASTVVGLAAPTAPGAGQRVSAGPETTSQCFAKLRSLVAALAKLDHLAEEAQAGKVYVFFDGRAYYPVDKGQYQTYVAIQFLLNGVALDLAKLDAALAYRTGKQLKRLLLTIESGHELVQAREKRCNDLKNGNGTGASSTPTTGGAAGGGGAGAGSYTLAGAAEVANPYGNTTINAQGRTAHVDAGNVTWDEHWTLPASITPGEKSSITLGLDITNNGPKPGPGQYTVGVKVQAPGLTEQYTLDLSSQLNGEKTYTWAVPASTTGTELTIVINPYESSSVTYHYRK